uniref:Uncharacterized protein n=1 Tax=Calidris pygmaea TaxID=425635 RepID=A0A8C3JCR8_9CHAR
NNVDIQHSQQKRCACVWLLIAGDHYACSKTDFNFNKRNKFETQLNQGNMDFKMEAEKKRSYPDVIAHVHTCADSCPKAAGIVHFGDASCYLENNMHCPPQYVQPAFPSLPGEKATLAEFK